MAKKRSREESKLCETSVSHSNQEEDTSSWFCLDNNPHLEQTRGINNIKTVEEYDLNRVLRDSSPQMPYRRRANETKSVVHWGQRKLLLSEIEFLSKFAHDGITCVYAGAAPGTHITFLADLFPEVHFVLIDPSDFSIEPSSQITTRQEFMTDNIAKEFKNMRTLLISDIRSADWRIMNNQQLEETIARDMQWQMDWHLHMSPIAALLKFRLPWFEGITTYLDGDIYLPVWGPQTTTESPTQEDSLSESIIRLIEAITIACNGKNTPRSTSYRTLIDWQRTSNNFRRKIFDVENLQIIELDEETKC
eukprot:gene5607-11321_t